MAQVELQLSFLRAEIADAEGRIELGRIRLKALEALADGYQRLVLDADPPPDHDGGRERRVTFRAAVLRVLADAGRPITAAVLRDRVEGIAGPVSSGTISVTLARLRDEAEVELTDRRRWRLATKPIEGD